jgi:hypothetical protein
MEHRHRGTGAPAERAVVVRSLSRAGVLAHLGGLVALIIVIWGSGLGGEGLAQETPPEGPAITASPSIRPVITESDRDGLLLGLDLSLDLRSPRFGAWTLGAGGALGLRSQAGRFRTRFSFGEVAGISYGDWPASLVLGRQGEQGVHVTADIIALDRLLIGDPGGFLGEVLQRSKLQGTGFFGTLWPGEDETEGPNVRYAHLKGFLHWPLPWGFLLESQGELLFGQLSGEPQRSFQTFFSSTRLWVDQTALEIKMGELENPADLRGFRFDLGLRSYPAPFEGSRFVLGSLQQQFEVLSVFLAPLDLTALLGPRLGWIPVHLRMFLSVFLEGGIVFAEEDREGELLFGWGTSLVFPDLDLKIHIAINREGSPNLVTETGVLP